MLSSSTSSTGLSAAASLIHLPRWSALLALAPTLLMACDPTGVSAPGETRPETCCNAPSTSSAQLDSGLEPASGEQGATTPEEAGTPGTPTAPATPAVSFATQVAPVLLARCGGCHGTRGGLTLTPAATAYASLVGIASNADASMLRVAPGEPEKSLVFLSITDDERSAVGRMPTRQPLSAIDPAAVELIREWITQGAPNN